MIVRVFALIGFLFAASAHASECLTFWHAYRGDEASALNTIAQLYQDEKHVCVDVLAVPYEVMASKLTTAISQNNGPDVFIFAHERLGSFAQASIIDPLAADSLTDFIDVTKSAVTLDGKVWALPLSIKTLALYYRTDLIATPPSSTRDFETLRKTLAKDITVLGYATDDFFFHNSWFSGMGGRILDANDVPSPIDFEQPAFIKSLKLVRAFQDQGMTMEEPSNALVTQRFKSGQIAMVMSGPWLLGELSHDIPFAVTSLPRIDFEDVSAPAKPFVTVEAIYLAAHAKPTAFDFMRFVTSQKGAAIRRDIGKQIVANRDIDTIASSITDAKTLQALSAFATQAQTGLVMDARPQMRDVWEPAVLALKKTLRGDVDPALAAKAAQQRYRIITKPAPQSASPGIYVFVLIAVIALVVVVAVKRSIVHLRHDGVSHTAFAWMWILPAIAVTCVLVIVPFVVAMGLAFFHHEAGHYRFVGLANFVDIVLSRSYAVFEPLSFYYALIVTIVWTVSNVFIHVVIGLSLALLLQPKLRRFKPFYRTLLILPWAIPNYITALMFKSIFHKQVGAINAMLNAFGFDSVSWFSSFPTAFFANLCTNAWLGFPFMMVVCLGALQSIPSDLYEACDIDGASGWQKFTNVTLPLLRPALLPAVMLGVVWTFNAFNVVYLVSGGEPDSSTELLISEAWRWGFSRREQYGYAAAYGVLIFLLLFVYTRFSERALKKLEPA